MQRVIKNDLEYKSYIKRIAPKFTDVQKQKRFSFGISVRKNIRKSLSRKIRFPDEKKDLIWMDFIVDKMIEYGLRAVNKLMLMVEFIEKQSFLKVLWYGSKPVMNVLLV